MKQSVKNIILDIASKRGQVVYGQRAVNEQLPVHLKRKTSDYDIYSSKPEIAAKELVSKLNKSENGYKILKAKYGRTWKVKDKENNSIADYTQPSRYPKSKIILGVKYADLDYAKRKFKKILTDESSSYRHDKDRAMLERIKKGEVMPW